MIGYCIASGTSAAALEYAVNKRIADGWEPQGGIGVRSWVQTEYSQTSTGTVSVHHAELLQAMVRKSP